MTGEPFAPWEAKALGLLRQQVHLSSPGHTQCRQLTPAALPAMCWTARIPNLLRPLRPGSPGQEPLTVESGSLSAVGPSWAREGIQQHLCPVLSRCQGHPSPQTVKYKLFPGIAKPLALLDEGLLPEQGSWLQPTPSSSAR